MVMMVPLLLIFIGYLVFRVGAEQKRDYKDLIEDEKTSRTD